MIAVGEILFCFDCPPVGYHTDDTRCWAYPRLNAAIPDRKPDNSGLDDGVPLDSPRKKSVPKPAGVTTEIRARAWATRRENYGERGHR